jgi:hypothetical protein
MHDTVQLQNAGEEGVVIGKIEAKDGKRQPKQVRKKWRGQLSVAESPLET